MLSNVKDNLHVCTSKKIDLSEKNEVSNKYRLNRSTKNIRAEPRLS